MSMTSVVLGVDVGGTAIKAGVFDPDGRALHVQETASPGTGGDDLIAEVAAIIAGLTEWANHRNHQVLRAGVVVPGMVDETRGRVLFAANLTWRNVDLAAILEKLCLIPVIVGHDVRSAALAERSVGAARGLDDFILVTIGTGISSAIHTDGITRVGATGSAGELGHIPVVADGERCQCGQRGCLEVYASAGGIVRRYRAAGGPADATARTIADQSATDELARRVWGEATGALAVALATVILLLDPAVIFLGGGLARAGRVLLDPTTVKMAEHLRWRPAPPVRLSSLGTGAGRVGAALLALQPASNEASKEQLWK